MARHYSTKHFFRQVPNALLARYFEDQGLFGDLDFAALKETKPDELFAAIIDEARWQMQAEPEALTGFIEALSALPNHYHRAMVTYLDHGERSGPHCLDSGNDPFWGMLSEPDTQNRYAYVYNNPLLYTDPLGQFGGTSLVGLAAGFSAGCMAGGLKGCIVGGVVGFGVGFVLPWAAEAAGTWAADWVAGAESGGSVAGDVAKVTAGAVTVSGTGAFAGGAGAVVTNLWEGNSINKDVGWATGVGALAPLASGEAIFLGAVGARAGAFGFGKATELGFSAGTGLFAIGGTAVDPNAEYGLMSDRQVCN